MPDIRQLLLDDAARLVSMLALDAADARLEVQYLQQQALQRPRAWLLAHPEYEPDESQLAVYRQLLQRRLQGEPVAYILGEREFFSLNFKLTPDVLIPRPETELLVELALRQIPAQSPCRVLDLGTGSGAIALSIAHGRGNAEVTAVDASSAALGVAQANAHRLDIGNVHFVQGSWFDGLYGQRFDVIVSNPPYVAAEDRHLNQGDLPFEPIAALVSGSDGLDDIRRIIGGAPGHLLQDGWLLLEHGYDQGSRVRELLRQSGFSEVFSAPDLSGIERVSGGRFA